MNSPVFKKYYNYFTKILNWHHFDSETKHCRDKFVEINVTTNTITVLDVPLWFLFFLPNQFAFLTFATDTGKSETFLCQPQDRSPSSSPCGWDHAQLKQYLAIFLFFSFLKVVDSHFLSFFFPLFLSASYEDSQYKCNRWRYLQIYKLKEKKYYGGLLGSLLKWKYTWTMSMVKEYLNQLGRNKGTWSCHSCCFRVKKALCSARWPACPLPCICPWDLPAAAGSRAPCDIPSHISSASWSVPAGVRGRAC